MSEPAYHTTTNEDRMNAPDKTPELPRDIAREFLLGELIKAASKHLKTLEQPWIKLPQSRQDKVMRELYDDIREAVHEAVDIIATDGRIRFRAEVESVTFKDGVKAVLKMGNTEASHRLADQAEGYVLVVIEDAVQYLGTGDAMKTQPDQPELQG